MTGVPTPLAWAVGCALLALELGALAVVAVAVRRRLDPVLAGAEARLAEVVVGVAVALGVGGLLGSVGWFARVPVALALVALALVAQLVSPARPPVGPATSGRAPASGAPAGVAPSAGPRWLVGLAAATTAAVVASWAVQVAAGYRRGIYDGDSLWYHQPFAARFVQSGWVTRIHHVNGEPLVSYFPANSELLQALLTLPSGSDGLAPIVNLGWLALLVLAGWVAGARRGLGAAGVVAALVVAAVPVVLLTQAGTARNDVMGYALLAAGLVLGLDAGPHRGRVAIAATALGLAAGVKVSLLAPVALVLLALTAAWLLAHRRRALPAVAVLAGVFGLVAAPWYLRNWIRIGNPVPWVAVHVGPIRFEKPALPQAAVEDSSLAMRLDEAGWWSTMVRPGLDEAFGPLWWVLLLAVAGAAVAVLVRRGGDRWAPGRLLAGAALAAGVAYVVTPNSAALSVGEPLATTIYSLNTRYLVPAVVIGLLVGARALPVRAAVPLAAVTAVVSLVALWPGGLRDGFEWQAEGRDVVAAGLAVAALGALAGSVVLARRRAGAGASLAVLGVAAVLGAAGAGVVVRHHTDGRWREPAPFAAASTWPYAADLRHERIGVVGDFFQYPYTGRAGTNHVQYIGVPEPHGGFRDARSCREWRRALVAADVDHLVVTRQIFGGAPEGPAEWTATDPSAREVRTDEGGRVFRFDGPVDPDGCG